MRPKAGRSKAKMAPSSWRSESTLVLLKGHVNDSGLADLR